MNSWCATGWVVTAPTRRTRADGLGTLDFCIGIRDEDGGEHIVDCITDDQLRLEEWESLLTPGRVVVMRGEWRSRDRGRLGVVLGSEKFCRVLGMEFPDRRRAQIVATPAIEAAL